MPGRPRSGSISESCPSASGPLKRRAADACAAQAPFRRNAAGVSDGNKNYTHGNLPLLLAGRDGCLTRTSGNACDQPLLDFAPRDGRVPRSRRRQHRPVRAPRGGVASVRDGWWHPERAIGKAGIKLGLRIRAGTRESGQCRVLGRPGCSMRRDPGSTLRGRSPRIARSPCCLPP